MTTRSAARALAARLSDEQCANLLLVAAVRSVIVKLVSEHLPGGQEEFWRLVCEELPRQMEEL